ncbi:MAG: hypothetical protein Q8S40_11865, partial [Falsiroseomonas sp.]|nr:hypothetical protein [Falsiroseomonas sp.]
MDAARASGMAGSRGDGPAAPASAPGPVQRGLWPGGAVRPGRASSPGPASRCDGEQPARAARTAG